MVTINRAGNREGHTAVVEATVLKGTNDQIGARHTDVDQSQGQGRGRPNGRITVINDTTMIIPVKHVMKYALTNSVERSSLEGS